MSFIFVLKVASNTHVSARVCFRLDDANRGLIDAREKIDRQNQQLSDYEAEVKLLRRRVEGWDNEREKDKRQIAMLQDALNRARIVSTCN